MKQVHVVLIATGAATMLAAAPLRAAVHVDTAEVKEKLVAFQTAEGTYIGTDTGGALNTVGPKIGSKQKFTLVDLNGGELQDGDGVKIRYTPNSRGAPDTSKSSYWIESKDGIKRGHDADIFKVKKVETKYALQAPSGKYVGPAPTPATGMLGLSDKLEGALLLDIVDPTAPVSKSKTPKEPVAAPAPASPEKPASE
jgi:hypothetical protein